IHSATEPAKAEQVRPYNILCMPDCTQRKPGRLKSLAACPISTAFGHRCPAAWRFPRSEEHTSELQSRENLVCRLLLEKKTVLFVTPVIILNTHKPNPLAAATSGKTNCHTTVARPMITGSSRCTGCRYCRCGAGTAGAA